MIFVTLGTTHMAFPRLVEGLRSLPLEEVVIQHGPATPPEGVKRAVEFLDFGEMLEVMDEADAVVTHAGVGTVLVACRLGHRPVVVPRLKRYKETVDDHQVELCEALGRQGIVVPVWDIALLPEAVASTHRGEAPDLTVERPLHTALRDALQRGGDGAGRRRRGLLRRR